LRSSPTIDSSKTAVKSKLLLLEVQLLNARRTSYSSL
jgi:hypothetical protein